MLGRQSTGMQLVMLSSMKFWTQTVSLIKTMVIARIFTLTEYATYTKMILILDFAFAIIVLNLPSSATYFVSNAENKNEKENIIYTFYAICTLVGTIMGLGLYLLTPILCKCFNCPYMINCRWYLCLTSLFQIISTVNSYILTSQGKSIMAVRISFCTSIFTLIGLFVAYRSMNSFYMCLLLMTIIEGCAAAIAYGIGIIEMGGIKNIISGRVFVDKFLIKKIYAFIIPVGLSSVVLIINTRVDKVLVSINYSNDYYAIYANASKELPVVALSAVIASVIVPKLVKQIKRNENDLAVQTWRHALMFVSTISFLLLAGTFTFAPEVMMIIYSDKYLEGVGIFRIYLFLIPFHCIGYTLLLSALGQTKYIFRSSLVALIINVIFDIIGLKIIGVSGLGIATIIATIVMVILQLYYTSKCLNIKMVDLVPMKKMVGLMILNVSLAILAKIAQIISPLDKYFNTVLEALFVGLIWSLFYFLLVKNRLLREWRGLNYGD